MAVAAATLVLVVAAPVRAQTGGGELGPDFVRASAADLGAGTFPGGGLPTSTPSGDSPYSWTRVDTGGACVVLSGPVPPELVDAVHPLPQPGSALGVPTLIAAPIGAPAGAVWIDDRVPLPPGAVTFGEYGFDIGTARAGGNVVVIPRCARPGDPLLPVPPTAVAIWQQTPLPREAVSANPPGTHAWPGIVNLESWFWGKAMPDAEARVTLDGYTVTVVAHAVAYAWSFGDGTTSVGADPGSRSAPARAGYRRRGDYDVALFVVWAGRAHISQPAWGLDFGDLDLGTVTIPERVVYHEAEIRAVLRSRTAG